MTKDTAMHPLWLFQGLYEALRECAMRGTGEFAYRSLAAELRKLLLDGTSIADEANRMFRLTVTFPVYSGDGEAEFIEWPGGVELNKHLLDGPPAMSRPNQSRTDDLRRDAFLALPAVRLAQTSLFSVREVILAGANLAGGVHSVPQGIMGERLAPLASALFGPRILTGSDLLLAVARHVLEAHRHLFTLAQGTSLGLAQPRGQHAPLLRAEPGFGPGGIAMECSGREFFEDGLPSGLAPGFAWVGHIAVRASDPSEMPFAGAILDRFVLDIGCLNGHGPQFSVIQRGQSVVARFVSAGRRAIETPPVRLMNRRYYSLAAGVGEVGDDKVLRVFIRLGPQYSRNVEAFGPVGVAFGPTTPSRVALGAALDRSEAKAGRGALMQFKEAVFLRTASERDVDTWLESFRKASSSRRWVTSSLPEARVTVLYNQMRSG